MIHLQKYCYVLICFLLPGCSTMNDQFSCPMKPGVQCQSLDQVNAKIDKNDIKHFSSSSEDSLRINAEPLTVTTKVGSSPVRSPETLVPVWIAPYEDTIGNYHEASVIWTVTKSGYWKNNYEMNNQSNVKDH
jgi:conjugal transfer pilus assembly protein TraV